jgi:hypothetical protein
VEHRVAISLKHVGFLSGSLHDILHKATYYSSTHYSEVFNYSGCGYVPSSTAPRDTLTPDSEPRQLGQQGHQLIAPDRHGSSRLPQPYVPSGLAQHLEFRARTPLPPCSLPGAHRHVPPPRPRGLLQLPARGLSPLSPRSPARQPRFFRSHLYGYSFRDRGSSSLCSCQCRVHEVNSCDYNYYAWCLPVAKYTYLLLRWLH